MASERPIVMVVDDEPDICEIVALAFMREGYQVVVAHGLAEALERARGVRLDAVVSDVRMPGGDGPELLECLRASRQPIRAAVLMSGFAERSTGERALAGFGPGAGAVFQKPFDRRALVAFVVSRVSRASTPEPTAESV